MNLSKNPSLYTLKLVCKVELYALEWKNLLFRFLPYRDIFKSHFNLRFGVPRSDTCKYCDKIYLALTEADEKDLNRIERELETHHETADKAYASLKEDSEISKVNDNVVVLCVDLQQVLYTPMLTHSDVFYQRQYSNYNFAIHNQAKNASMFLWHERIANRGSIEIASCIMKYIKENFEILLPGQSRKLILWSDRCVGQNNNWNMIGLCAYLVHLNYFTEVNQKFLTSGHSFLPCDRDFALIERQKKKNTCYIPQHLIEMIKNSNILNSFEIVEMQQSDFFDFNQVQKSINKDPKLKITEARWIQLTADDPNIIRVRKDHNILLPWVSFSLIGSKKRGNKTSSNRLNFPKQLNLIYIEELAIPA